MKNFFYDAEGDILTVTFNAASENVGTGIELHENIILYLVPGQWKVLELILMSYRAILNSPTPLRFDALAEFSAEWQQKIIDIIQTEPLAHFLGIEYSAPGKPALLYVKKVFDPEIMQVAA